VLAGCGFSIGTAFLAWIFSCIYTTAFLLSYLPGYVLRRYTKGFGEKFLLSHNITIESRIYVHLLIYLSLAFAWLRCCVRGISSPSTIGVSDCFVDCYFVFLSFVDFFLSRRTCFARSLYVPLPVNRDRCWKWFWRETRGSRFSTFLLFVFRLSDGCASPAPVLYEYLAGVGYYLLRLVYFEDFKIDI